MANTSEPISRITARSVTPSDQNPVYQNVNYSPEAFGAGIGRALGQLGDTIGESGQIAAKLQGDVKANDAMARVNSAKDELRAWMYDPKDGIMAKNGGAAMGVGGQIDVVTKDIQQRYLDDIDDPVVKQAFTKLWTPEAEAAKDTTARHELTQVEVFKENTTKATLDGALTDAYTNFNNDAQLGQIISNTRKAIRMNSVGLPEEAVALAEKQAVSSLHLAAVSRWAQEDPYKALDYYTEHKSEFVGKDHVTATEFTNIAKNERAADEQVARITGTGGVGTNTLYSAVEKAESGGQDNQVSSAGALGRMQLMPDTARGVAKRLGMTDVANLPDNELKERLLKDNSLNRTLGRAELDYQLKNFNGDMEAALVAYNAGPAAAEAFLEHNVGNSPGNRDYDVPGYKGVKSESEAYVKKIMGYMGSSSNTSGGIPIGTRMTRDNWSLRNFKPEDMMAPSGDAQWVDANAAIGLDNVVEEMKTQFPGFAAKINEDWSPSKGYTTTAGKRRGTSSPKDNPHVENSQHLKGTAFDVQWQTWSPAEKVAFIQTARAKGFGGIGFYGDSGHIHIDMGPTRSWGPMPAWAKEAMNTPVGKISGKQISMGGAGGTGYMPGEQGSYFADIKMPDLKAWKADADQIADPSLRARVNQKLAAQAGAMTEAAKAESQAAEDEAWRQTVANGQVPTDPRLIAKIDPGKLNSMYSYLENKTSGKDNMDWEKWAGIPWDNQLLANMNVNDYRAVLDDSHFDQLVKAKRDAQKAMNGDVTAQTALAGTRNVATIIKDTAAAMNWSEKNKTDQTRIANLARMMDEKLIKEQQLKGKELNSVEIQDIADKLVLIDQGRMFGAKAAIDPGFDPATFEAAEVWTDVQPDDQQLLIERYRRVNNNEVPDQEYAVDLYNRAMRVYFGGPADGPAMEKAEVRAGFEEKLGRQITNGEFEDYYGQWLLYYLGR